MTRFGASALDRWVGRRGDGAPMAHAAALGLMHALVDASTVTAVFRSTRVVEMSRVDAFSLIVAYNLLAFGLQPLVGWVSDRYRLPRLVCLAGLWLPMVALVSHSIHPALTVASAGLGNALFHVGAGVLVLEHGVEKTAPAGVFVGPGALGLGFGVWFGRQPAAGPVWPLVLALVLALAVVVPWWRDGARSGRLRAGLGATEGARRSRVSHPLAEVALAAVALLLVSVAVRSLVGGAALRGVPVSTSLVVGAPIAACLGKALGGLLADRVGWLEVTGAALVTSAPLLVWGAGATPLLLLGLLLFQTTMPVTLVAVARALPRGARGVAFGLPCLALVLGSLPGLTPGAEAILERPVLLGWVALGLVTVIPGLWLLGLRPRQPLLSTHGDEVTV